MKFILCSCVKYFSFLLVKLIQLIKIQHLSPPLYIEKICSILFDCFFACVKTTNYPIISLIRNRTNKNSMILVTKNTFTSTNLLSKAKNYQNHLAHDKTKNQVLFRISQHRRSHLLPSYPTRAVTYTFPFPHSILSFSL